MTYRLGCELSDVLAAIAPVSGNMATASGSADVPCTPSNPVSVLAIHGTADGTIPIAGGKVDIIFSPMADVIARWRSLDGCADASTVALDGSTTATTWACAGGSNVATRSRPADATAGRPTTRVSSPTSSPLTRGYAADGHDTEIGPIRDATMCARRAFH